MERAGVEGEIADISAGNDNPKPHQSPRNFHWLAFLILLALGAYLRCFSFFLPSNIGDSSAYQSLAMKMNHGFMQEYNIFNYRMTHREDTGLVDYIWDENPKNWNARRIRAIYHRSLHLQPPLYPILIWLSHGVFNRGMPYTSVAKNLRQEVVQNPPWEYLRAQFYAVIVPFLLSIGTLLLTYLFCLHFFSFREGLIAVAILVASPVDLAVGPKVYADGILTFFTLLSIYWFFKSLSRDDVSAPLWAALAGIALGLAYLTKITGALFAFALACATFLSAENPKKALRRLAQPRLMTAGLCALLVASPWLWLMYRHYGTIFVNTPADPSNPWYRYVFSRPLRAYPLDLIWFVPPLALGAMQGILAWIHPFRRWIEASLFAMTLVYMAAFMVFARSGTAGVEDRYLLPIYPLLAILSGALVVRCIGKIPMFWVRIAAYTLAVGILTLSGWRSAQIGLHHVFSGIVVFKPLGF